MLKSDFIKSKIYEMLTRKWAENGNGLFGIFNHMKTGVFGKWHEPDPNDLVLHLRHKLKTQMKKERKKKTSQICFRVRAKWCAWFLLHGDFVSVQYNTPSTLALCAQIYFKPILKGGRNDSGI